jgi:hypothetical protein
MKTTIGNAISDLYSNTTTTSPSSSSSSLLLPTTTATSVPSKTKAPKVSAKAKAKQAGKKSASPSASSLPSSSSSATTATTTSMTARATPIMPGVLIQIIQSYIGMLPLPYPRELCAQVAVDMPSLNPRRQPYGVTVDEKKTRKLPWDISGDKSKQFPPLPIRDAAELAVLREYNDKHPPVFEDLD